MHIFPVIKDDKTTTRRLKTNGICIVVAQNSAETMQGKLDSSTVILISDLNHLKGWETFIPPYISFLDAPCTMCK